MKPIAGRVSSTILNVDSFVYVITCSSKLRLGVGVGLFIIMDLLWPRKLCIKIVSYVVSSSYTDKRLSRRVEKNITTKFRGTS